MFKSKLLICSLFLVLGMGQVEGAESQPTDDPTFAEWYTGIQTLAWDRLSGDAQALIEYAIETKNWAWEQLPPKEDVYQRLKELKDWTREQSGDLYERMGPYISSIKKGFNDRREHPDAFQDVKVLEQYVHKKVNEYRQSKGRNPLKFNHAIADIARQHSENMANGLVPFSHDGAEHRSNQILLITRTTSTGENLAYNFGFETPGLQAVYQWIGSDGHREAMENANFKVTGVGIAVAQDGTVYFTQLFAN